MSAYALFEVMFSRIPQAPLALLILILSESIVSQVFIPFIGPSFKITSISPKFGPSPGGYKILINGNGIHSGMRITISGAVCSDWTVIDQAKGFCTVPANSLGPSSINATNVSVTLNKNDTQLIPFGYVGNPVLFYNSEAYEGMFSDSTCTTTATSGAIKCLKNFGNGGTHATQPTTGDAPVYTAGSGLRYTRPNSYMSLTPTVATSQTTFTVLTWTNQTYGGSGDTWTAVFSQRKSDGKNSIAYHTTGSTLDLKYSFNDNAATWGWNSGISLTSATWTFHGFTTNASNQTIFKRNFGAGALSTATRTYAATAEFLNGAGSNTRIGTDANLQNSRYLNGYIEVVGVYVTQLSTAELNTIYSFR